MNFGLKGRHLGYIGDSYPLIYFGTDFWNWLALLCLSELFGMETDLKCLWSGIKELVCHWNREEVSSFIVIAFLFLVDELSRLTLSFLYSQSLISCFESAQHFLSKKLSKIQQFFLKWVKFEDFHSRISFYLNFLRIAESRVFCMMPTRWMW